MVESKKRLRNDKEVLNVDDYLPVKKGIHKRYKPLSLNRYIGNNWKSRICSEIQMQN